MAQFKVLKEIKPRVFPGGWEFGGGYHHVKCHRRMLLRCRKCGEVFSTYRSTVIALKNRERDEAEFECRGRGYRHIRYRPFHKPWDHEQIC